MPRVSSAWDVDQVPDPVTPTAGTQYIYAKSDGKVYTKTPNAAVLPVGGGSLATLTSQVTFSTTQLIVLQAMLPANGVAVGSVIRVRWYGLVGTTSSLPTMRIRLGSTGTLASDLLGAVTLTGGTAAANSLFQGDAMLVVRSVGNPGVLLGNASGSYAATTIYNINGTTVAPNTTVPLYITLTAQASVATTTASIQVATIEIL